MNSADFASFFEVFDHLKLLKKGDWIKIGIVTCIAAIFLVFIAWPAWGGRLDLQGKIKGLEGREISFETMRKSKPKMIAERQSASELIRRAKEQIHSAAEASLILGSVSKLANEAEVIIISSNPRDSESKFPAPFSQNYYVCNYDFNVEGKFHDIGKFISLVENSPKLLKITHCKITLRDQTDKDAFPALENVELTLSAIAQK